MSHQKCYLKRDGILSNITVWLPKQYGAWAMLLAPALAGVLLAGFHWQNLLVLLAWTTAYLAFMAVLGMLAGRQKQAHVVAAAVYAVAALAMIAALLWWRLALVWWGVPLALLLGTAMVMTVAGRQRSTVNDACLIGASCLMTAVSATCLQLPASLALGGFAQAVAQPIAWLATAIMAGYFLGTIPYIKTMIRERGHKGWYIASVAYHCLIVVLAVVTLRPALIAFAVLITARAAVVPKVWPRAKPKHIGLGEMAGTVIILVIIWLTLVH